MIYDVPGTSQRPAGMIRSRFTSLPAMSDEPWVAERLFRLRNALYVIYTGTLLYTRTPVPFKRASSSSCTSYTYVKRGYTLNKEKLACYGLRQASTAKYKLPVIHAQCTILLSLPTGNRVLFFFFK